MKVLYTGVQYSFYKRSAGLSFEHTNFYLSLKNMPGVETLYVPFDRILEVGKKRFNQELKEAIERERPELLFVFMLSDEIDKKLLEEVRKKGTTKTVAWFADDNWRFWNYAAQWAPRFDWAVTPYPSAFERYKKFHIGNPLRSQWAANLNVFKPSFDSRYADNDVAFVGSWSKPREKVIRALEHAGIPVFVKGGGWPSGRASEEEMIRIFSSAKINLALNPAPGYWNVNSLGRLAFRRSVDRIIPDFHVVRNARAFLDRNIVQVKARHFEIPACGGFLITSDADGLRDCFEDRKEIVVYNSIRDLADAIRYYLSHAEERKSIARAGYERTIRDHTYEKRFREVFKAIGLHYE